MVQWAKADLVSDCVAVKTHEGLQRGGDAGRCLICGGTAYEGGTGSDATCLDFI